MNEENGSICGNCAGSGEGRYEATCLKCNGSGMLYLNNCHCCGLLFETGNKKEDICSAYCLGEMKAEANGRI